MEFYPDFGTYISEQGLTRDHREIFMDFTTDHIGFMDLNKMTAMATWVVDGTTYAVSVDFDKAAFIKILQVIDAAVAQFIREQLEGEVELPLTLQLPKVITFGFSAVLGEPVESKTERFIPFVIDKVLGVE